VQNKIKEFTPLSELTTMRVGGPARFFSIAETIEDVKSAVSFVREKNIPIFVLGEGSNIVMGDRGFPGLVLKMRIPGVSFHQVTPKNVEAIVFAGECWDAFVEKTVRRGLWGLENLSFIPGTAGAAPVQNIGAYGTEVRETIKWVEFFDMETMSVRKLSNEECRFSYRDSIFKHSEGLHLIILKICFSLVPYGAPRTEYKDVMKYTEHHRLKNPSLSQMREIIIAIRKSKLPDVSEYGTVGSFFKNPIVTRSKAKELLKQFPDMPHHAYGTGEEVKISLAWILDNVCSCKGMRIGDIAVYDRQPLALINFGKENAHEVRALANRITALVKEKTGIDIIPEPSFVGEF